MSPYNLGILLSDVSLINFTFLNQATLKKHIGYNEYNDKSCTYKRKSSL